LHEPDAKAELAHPKMSPQTQSSSSVDVESTGFPFRSDDATTQKERRRQQQRELENALAAQIQAKERERQGTALLSPPTKIPGADQSLDSAPIVGNGLAPDQASPPFGIAPVVGTLGLFAAGADAEQERERKRQRLEEHQRELLAQVEEKKRRENEDRLSQAAQDKREDERLRKEMHQGKNQCEHDQNGREQLEREANMLLESEDIDCNGIQCDEKNLKRQQRDKHLLEL
jgi:hypothetical protein